MTVPADNCAAVIWKEGNMLKVFSMTDIGRRRAVNQDYVYTSDQPVGNLPNLFLVADGMGGHRAGDYASKYAAETIVQSASQDPAQDAVEILKNAVEEANRKVFQKAGEEPALSGMGTTVVVASCADGRLTVANVGDSRLYVVNQEIRQITRDHSLVEEMVRLGTLSKEAARNHPNKNIITRAVGTSEWVQADLFQLELSEGDTILMCSDGLSNMLEDQEICSILRTEGEIREKGISLIEAANENGGADNIAVVLVEL